jgi:hypothetical protein
MGTVGDFGQNIVAELLDCSISPRGNTDFADLFSENLGIRVEVKTCDNNHRFVFKHKQLRGYQDEDSVPFPISDTLYALLGYRNRKSIKDHKLRPKRLRSKTFSELARLLLPGEQAQYLADRVDELYLLDLDVVTALEDILPTSTNYFPGHQGKTSMSAGRSELRSLFRDSDFSRLCRTLKLKECSWVREILPISRPVSIGDLTFTVEYRLIALLKKSTYKMLLQTLRSKAQLPQ